MFFYYLHGLFKKMLIPHIWFFQNELLFAEIEYMQKRVLSISSYSTDGISCLVTSDILLIHTFLFLGDGAAEWQYVSEEQGPLSSLSLTLWFQQAEEVPTWNR